MCVVNKQFELLKFVFDYIYVDLQYDNILRLVECMSVVMNVMLLSLMSVMSPPPALCNC